MQCLTVVKCCCVSVKNVKYPGVPVSSLWHPRGTLAENFGISGSEIPSVKDGIRDRFLEEALLANIFSKL